LKQLKIIKNNIYIILIIIHYFPSILPVFCYYFPTIFQFFFSTLIILNYFCDYFSIILLLFVFQLYFQHK